MARRRNYRVALIYGTEEEYRVRSDRERANVKGYIYTEPAVSADSRLLNIHREYYAWGEAMGILQKRLLAPFDGQATYWHIVYNF
jgi:hypothetical protein